MRRVIRYSSNDEELGYSYCDEDCKLCNQRFQCYTSRKSVLIADNPTAKQLHTLQTLQSLLVGCKILRCPHCQHMFKVTTKQLDGNTKFRCKVCGRYNWGSCKADKYGILIGELNAESDN